MGSLGTHTGLGRIIASGVLKDAVMAPGMRVLSSYTVVYVLDGRAWYRNPRVAETPVRPGDLILVFPNHPHHYNARPGGHWKQIYFMFDSPMFDLWRAQGLIDPARPIHHVEPVEFWFKRFDSVRGKAPVVEILALQTILAEVLLNEEADSMSRHDLDWAARVCSILEKDPASRTTIPELAGKMGLEYENFRKRFTRIMNQSPLQYRNRCLIDRACRLMQETNLTNKEIAYQLGFCDEFHFSHRFKKIAGRSPNEFRRTLSLKIKVG